MVKEAREARRVKDERTVTIKDNDIVEFKHEEIQHYSHIGARNAYVNMLDELEQKINIISKSKEIQKQADQMVSDKLDPITKLARSIDKSITLSETKAWKKIQILVSQQEFKQKMFDMKQDIGFLKEGVDIWSPCEDLPETEYERALISRRAKARLEASAQEAKK